MCRPDTEENNTMPKKGGITKGILYIPVNIDFILQNGIFLKDFY